MNEKELSIELIGWFNKNKYISNKQWRSNRIAKIIKENLKRMDRFKYNKRGDPDKSKSKAEYNKAVREGYTGPWIYNGQIQDENKFIELE